MTVQSGDFRLCGVIIGMSIMQGGPASTYMIHGVSAFFTGCKMLTANITNSGYQEIAVRVSTTPSKVN